LKILSDLRGAARLACDATIGVTSVVERVHGNVLGLPPVLSKDQHRPGAGPARLVYSAIRGTTRLVRGTVDLGLAPWSSHDPETENAPARDALVAALNGACGDYLERSGNPLATTMRLRTRLHEATDTSHNHGPRLLVLAHGLCMNDRQWTRKGHDHGTALQKSLGLTPLYLRYNSGLSVQDNGYRLSELLEREVVSATEPVESVDLLGYSLGGLLVRSAYAAAVEQEHSWPSLLRKIVFLGTPHDGAPLERGGNVLDKILLRSPYLAPFSIPGKARSLGIQNLGHGVSAASAPLPGNVACFAVAGALADDPSRPGAAWIGDGLVPVASALGHGRAGNPGLGIPQYRQWIAPGLGHLDLLSDAAVFKKLEYWLAFN